MFARSSWQVFALGSAFFAALTAIFGKLGVIEINSNLATLIRTLVILLLISLVVSFRQEWEKPSQVPFNTWLFLILSALATGASWLCYYRALQLGPASKVAPVDKLSVVFVIFLGVIFLGEKLSWKIMIGGTLILAGSLFMLF